ncbi:hypothetical protein [Dietzia sp. PP-33]|jgi:hypothetical protein|nr:hypothetical protein [Dietzia sp. PP-33]
MTIEHMSMVDTAIRGTMTLWVHDDLTRDHDIRLHSIPGLT